jgi:CheY-like chemotaxis protein
MTPVLYAEDEPDDAFFMQYAWQEAGVANPLVVVKDGKQAIDYLAGQGDFANRAKHPFPCLLLLDLKLPIKSGFEVLTWLHQQPAIASLKVVIVSASEQDSDIALARTLGAADYVVKPTSPIRLAEMVRERKSAWFDKT